MKNNKKWCLPRDRYKAIARFELEQRNGKDGIYSGAATAVKFPKDFLNGKGETLNSHAIYKRCIRIVKAYEKYLENNDNVDNMSSCDEEDVDFLDSSNVLPLTSNRPCTYACHLGKDVEDAFKERIKIYAAGDKQVTYSVLQHTLQVLCHLYGRVGIYNQRMYGRKYIKDFIERMKSDVNESFKKMLSSNRCSKIDSFYNEEKLRERYPVDERNTNYVATRNATFYEALCCMKDIESNYDDDDFSDILCLLRDNDESMTVYDRALFDA